jgi:hypothetical protein
VGAIDKEHLGKMQYYLRELLKANPDRPWARGAVFNGSDVVFFQATRSTKEEDPVEFQMHKPLSMDTGMKDNLLFAQTWIFNTIGIFA